MGVPAFFRWLCARNPQFILDVQENYENFDEESANPEIDNLYLDMNGIIHPCCRSDGSVVPIPHSIQDMFNNIFLYIDKLVDLIRPKKILYMAIDGVAPRAKMNQQRARRFKGAKEAVDLQLRKEELLKDFTSKNEINDDILAFVQHRFDTNVITPGTCFMRDLSTALQHYVLDRVNNHPLFKNLKIIFSDAGIPGEGEHKILDFIRVQRNSENYNPNTKHCLYGADADLIMLGLSTHEPYFYIIREQIVTQEEKRCSICQQSGHFQMDCPNEIRVEMGEKNIPVSVQKAQETKIRKGVLQSFQFAKLYVMRQYLNMRFSKFFFNEDLEQVLKMPYDIEKIIDDFVFMCFFVGNDFLPHIPNLSIRDGGIDALITIYEHTLTQVDDYLTNNGELNLKQVAKFIENMAVVEEQLMKFRRDKEERDKKNQINNQEKELKLKQLKPHLTEEEYLRKRKEWRLRDEKKVDIVNNETLIMRFKRVLQETQDESKTIKEVKESSSVTLNYNYKLAYYNDKFDVKPKDFVQMQQLIKQSYIEALCWNFAYYYKGCISWGWYYPFHYSPFASDLLDIDQHIIQFDRGQPFKPFQQLLSVFPPASALSVPACYQHLMVNPDSEIADFYPSDFYVDLIGKKFEWLGEVILPFIEEERLVAASEKYEHELSAEEQQRNSVSKLLLFYNQGAFQDMPRQLTQQEWDLIGELEDKPKYALNREIQLLDEKLNINRVIQNNVVCKPIVFPEFTKHDIQLLQGLIEPKEEISESYIQKTDMRTYQGENTIKLIKGILSGKDNETTWQKGFQGRINYNSGQSDYGNMLNIREMMKHQDQMSTGQQQQQQQRDFRGGRDYSNNNNNNAQNQYQQRDNVNHNVFNPLMEDRQNNTYGRQNYYNNNNNSGNQNNQNGQQYGRGGYQGDQSRQGYNNSSSYQKNGGRFGSGQQQQQQQQPQYQPSQQPYNSQNQYYSRNNNNNNNDYQQNNRRGGYSQQQGQSAVDLRAVGQIRAQHQYAQQNAPQGSISNPAAAAPSNLPQNNQYRDNPNQYFVPAQQADQKIQAPSYLNTFTYNNAQKSDKTKKIYEPSIESNDIDHEEYDPIEAIRKQFKKE